MDDASSSAAPPHRTKRGRGRPPEWDKVELVACLHGLMDKGYRLRDAALELANFMLQREGHTARERLSQQRARAYTIERRYREYRAKLLEPWNTDLSSQGLKLGPLMFLGRPHAVPLALNPASRPRPGRPRKR